MNRWSHANKWSIEPSSGLMDGDGESLCLNDRTSKQPTPSLMVPILGKKLNNGGVLRGRYRIFFFLESYGDKSELNR